MCVILVLLILQSSFTPEIVKLPQSILNKKLYLYSKVILYNKYFSYF